MEETPEEEAERQREEELYEQRQARREAARARGEALPEEDDEEEESEAPKPKLAAAKLIDFAHANWVPGQGPDKNSLQGVVSAADILKRIAEELASK